MRFAAGHWLYLLVTLPGLWAYLRWGDGRARQRLAALLGPRADEHVEHMPPAARQWRRFFLLAGLACLILALARPQWGAHEVVVRQRGTDVVIALDISNSMRAEDVVPSRLARARAELGTFLERFDRGRVGLVLFAGQAFVQCPLTLDLGTARLFLRMADPDMISAQGTALGAALSTGADLLASGAGDSPAGVRRAVILVTDGEDLEGGWQEAAMRCREQGIAVIPVGVGEETGGLIPLPGESDGAAGYLKDDEGQVVMSRLDLVSLQQLAEYGEGIVFRIGSRGLDIESLLALIAGLGERELDGRHVTRYEERFVWPLALALLTLWARTLVRARPVRRRAAATAGLALWLAVAAMPSATASVLEPPGAGAVARGIESYRSGDYEAALDAFLEARALDPDDPRLALAVGEAMSRLERHEEAAREFSRALALTDDPELRAEALYNAGTDALAAGDPALAAEQLRGSLTLEPDRLDTLRNLEYAVRMMEQAPPQQSQDSQDGEDGEQDEQQQQEGQQDQQDPSSNDQQQQQDQSSGEEESETEQQQQSQPEQPEESDAEDSQPQEGEQEAPDPEEISRERALSILKGLDRDEEELRRSLQKRLKGQEAASGKRW
ncbi:VWA domain-containing protein [bacterium]|nr:VWA domain-containing protein [bacterium]